MLNEKRKTYVSDHPGKGTCRVYAETPKTLRRAGPCRGSTGSNSRCSSCGSLSKPAILFRRFAADGTKCDGTVSNRIFLPPVRKTWRLVGGRTPRWLETRKEAKKRRAYLLSFIVDVFVYRLSRRCTGRVKARGGPFCRSIVFRSCVCECASGRYERFLHGTDCRSPGT